MLPLHCEVIIVYFLSRGSRVLIRLCVMDQQGPHITTRMREESVKGSLTNSETQDELAQPFSVARVTPRPSISGAASSATKTTPYANVRHLQMLK